MRHSFAVIAVLVYLCIGSPATLRAVPVDEFHDAADAAYGHYRAAMFYLRTGNTMVASFELDQMIDRWAAIVERFGPLPPDEYAADPRWRRTLEEIMNRAKEGLEFTTKGKAKAARNQLGPVRDLLSGLRRRNGITLYSDIVNEANGAFARLFRYRHHPPDFDDAEQVAALRRDLAATIHWYEKCLDEAPPNVRESEEFKRLMDRNLYSLSRIRVAIREKSRLNLINILRELHSSDQILFLRFG